MTPLFFSNSQRRIREISRKKLFLFKKKADDEVFSKQMIIVIVLSLAIVVSAIYGAIKCLSLRNQRRETLQETDPLIGLKPNGSKKIIQGGADEPCSANFALYAAAMLSVDMEAVQKNNEKAVEEI